MLLWHAHVLTSFYDYIGDEHGNNETLKVVEKEII